MALGVRITPSGVQSSRISRVFTTHSDMYCPDQKQEAPLTRPFFWEIVPLCDLYSIANVAVLPSSSLGKVTSTSNSLGETSGLAAIGSDQLRRLVQAFKDSGIDLADTKSTSSVLLFTILLPTTDGYVNRGDFFQLRLQDFPYAITRIHESLPPLEHYTSIPLSSDLPDLIYYSGAIIQWSDLDSFVTITQLQDILSQRTRELKDRLNGAPFLSPTPIKRKRVALVRGRPNITAGGPIYSAAKALGLDLVIVDEEGHWLQPDTAENRTHREAFLVTDMTEDEFVADRIINSIKSYPLPIHGVFTVSDNFFVTVARVAEALNLPSSPVSAFETSVDKYRSRLAQNTPGQTAKVSSVDELESLLSTATPNNPNHSPQLSPIFPMIVKPTKGWSSECVSKVTKLSDLSLAVEKATKRHGSAAVIEPFFDGPEIDVNFILLNGQILFSEIADEPPCDADSTTATVEATFSPEALTMPSSLPRSEQDLAKSTLRDILVKTGFHTGVFHVEARMVNSASEYRDDKGQGIIDLVPKKSPPPESPICRLIEINARPPGYRVSVPLKQTYGVDYFAAHMLAAVGEHDRLRLTARPFDYRRPDDDTPSRIQYYSRLVYIPAPASGKVQWKSSLPPCEDLKRRYPDLAKHISLGTDYHAPGDKIEIYTDGARTYVAHLLVYSRVSREEAIAIGNEVQQCYEIGIEEEEEEEEENRSSDGMSSFSVAPLLPSPSSISIPFLSLVFFGLMGWFFS